MIVKPSVRLCIFTVITVLAACGVDTADLPEIAQGQVDQNQVDPDQVDQTPTTDESSTENQPPVVVVTHTPIEGQLAPTTRIELNAADSHDDGDIVSFEWVQLTPDTRFDLYDSTEPTAHFYSHHSMHLQPLSFRVTVTDDQGLTSTADLSLTLEVNRAPTAIATGAIYVTPGQVAIMESRISSDSDGEIVSFLWEQTGGSTTVKLRNADTPSANFTVPFDTNDATFEFQLTVTDDRGGKGTGTIVFTSTPNQICETCDDGDYAILSNRGSFKTGQTGPILPATGTQIFIADQSSNQIDLRDAVTGETLQEISLSATPESMVYMQSANLLYVSYTTATKLSRIDLDTLSIEDIATTEAVASMAHTDSTVYFSVGDGPFTYPVYSIANADSAPVTHGNAEGETLYYLASFDQLLAVDSHSVFRYGFDTDSNLEELDEFKNGDYFYERTIQSPDEQHLAIASFRYNNGGRAVVDFSAADFSTVHGEWFTNGTDYNSPSAFSPSGELFVSNGLEFVHVFTTDRHTKLIQFSYGECGANNLGNIQQVMLSADEDYLITKLVCDDSKPKTTIVHQQLPTLTD